MSSFSSLPVPVDPTSRERLAESGLDARVVDPRDSVELTAWLRADNRGFQESEPDPATLGAMLEQQAAFRTIGVYDATIAEPSIPVATVADWVMDLTVSPDRTLPTWAISSVTVAPTHRRRGIARQMLEGELRSAADAGFPLAMLTVTEATIYGRYGFGPAALQAPWVVDTRRVRWSGPATRGRVQFVSPAALAESGPAIADAARRRTPGEVERWGGWWQRTLELTEPASERSRGLRAVRYDDENGVPQGFALYRLEKDYPSTLKLEHLVAATDDAYAGLWRFLCEMDLVGEIRASLRAVDEPLTWMIGDVRAAHKTDERDHLWLRVLDPARALAAREYAAAGCLALEIDDPLGLAAGSVLLDVDANGTAQARAGTDPHRPGLALGVAELGSLLLGGVSARALTAAGRVRERTAGDAQRADELFRSARTPHTSFWF